MTSDETKGLAKATEIYNDRNKRALELKADGKKIFGYFCCYAPLELLTTLDIVPFRVLGDMEEPITLGEAHLPSVMCVFYRSCLDIALKGRYEFFEGFVGTHACDAAQRVGQMWNNLMVTPYDFFLDLPHTKRDTAINFFRDQIGYFKESLEEYTGNRITDSALSESIALHNRQRALVRELYDLRKGDPPLVTGSEILQVMISLMCIPVDEGIELLEQVIAEVRERKNLPEKRAGRLLVWGSLIDNIAITELVESSGLNIVMDDTAIGFRPFMHDVEIDGDSLHNLARHYLEDIMCPRTFIETSLSYREHLEDRFGYLKNFIKKWNVNGVYLNLVRNCDPHGYEIPAIRDYLDALGIPVLFIEQDYSTASLEPLRTRVQAFRESIEG
ncbi:MAG: 2-hydroxyacyl-CoA dehydratase [Deltaproteobacteria bacterium]|nr:2-hydroxyacyl-CoA dehydratase [Deltaproteobacteria bacterium]